MATKGEDILLPDDEQQTKTLTFKGLVRYRNEYHIFTIIYNYIRELLMFSVRHVVV